MVVERTALMRASTPKPSQRSRSSGPGTGARAVTGHDSGVRDGNQHVVVTLPDWLALRSCSPSYPLSHGIAICAAPERRNLAHVFRPIQPVRQMCRVSHMDFQEACYLSPLVKINYAEGPN